MKSQFNDQGIVSRIYNKCVQLTNKGQTIRKGKN